MCRIHVYEAVMATTQHSITDRIVSYDFVHVQFIHSLNVAQQYPTCRSRTEMGLEDFYYIWNNLLEKISYVIINSYHVSGILFALIPPYRRVISALC